ncbi:MAG: FtsQ-type POTRA domain-containing protein [Firmicutes bacterium]|nr:FtsQ-type POTRA domain-containing protein [Bacillota bacterium]
MTLAKKTKKPRKKMNPRLFRKLLKTALALAVLGGLAALSLTVLFPVRRCTAEGETRYSADRFAEAMEIGAAKMNLFTADTDELTEKIHAALPYARVVKLSRRLPGTLHLVVEERAPAFAQQQGKLWWLLTREGRLLGTENAMPEGLMPITGAALLKPVPGQLAAWKNAFTTPADIAALLACLRESSLWPDITALRISTAAPPDAVYQDRIRIRFGTATPSAAASQEAMLAEKLRMAEEVIAEKNAQNPLQRGILDLSTYGKAYFTADWD